MSINGIAGNCLTALGPRLSYAAIVTATPFQALGRKKTLILEMTRRLHHAPVAFVPLMIRWGANASSDKLRRYARCTVCGHKGATLQHPGWVDTVVGFQPFPACPNAVA